MYAANHRKSPCISHTPNFQAQILTKKKVGMYNKLLTSNEMIPSQPLKCGGESGHYIWRSPTSDVSIDRLHFNFFTWIFRKKNAAYTCASIVLWDSPYYFGKGKKSHLCGPHVNNINFLLTEPEGRTGEYWTEVVTERTELRKQPWPNIPLYGSSKLG